MKTLRRQILKLSICSLFASALSGCSSVSQNENTAYNPHTLIGNALSACHQKDFSEGKMILEKVLTNEKANPHYWNALGICFALSGQPQKASFYYDVGLESVALYKGADKKFVEAAIMNNIGLIHLSFKRYNDAYATFKKAEGLAPDYFTIQLNLSQLFLEFKYNDKALTILNKLEITRPGDVDVLYSLALIYSRKSEYEKSLLALSKIKNEMTKRPDIAGLYAYNYLQTNQLPEAQIMIENRLSSEEYRDRNKILEKEITAKLKEQSALKKQ